MRKLTRKLTRTLGVLAFLASAGVSTGAAAVCTASDGAGTWFTYTTYGLSTSTRCKIVVRLNGSLNFSKSSCKFRIMAAANSLPVSAVVGFSCRAVAR